MTATDSVGEAALDAVPGAELAGYRMVRRVAGDGETARWLALAHGADVAVSVTLCRENGAARRLVTAQTLVRSRHVLALADIATDAEGRILLISERTDWSLATLLAARHHLADGEAVTVLAPLAAGLAAIHHAGLVHGHLRAGVILFTAEGRPVIGGLESARPDAITTAGSDGAPGPSEGIRSDHRALSTLIRHVAGSIGEGSRAGFTAVADWLDDATDQEPTGTLLSQLECRLFSLAPALPVVLVPDRRPAPAAPAPPHRGILPAAALAVQAVVGMPLVARVLSGLDRTGVSGWAGRAVHGRALALCLGVAVLVLALYVGLAVLPDTAARPERAGEPAVRSPRPAEAPPEARAGAPLTLTDGEAAAVAGDDAVAAVAALLALRARCAHTDSAGCVGNVAEQDSALAVADRHAMYRSGGGDLLLVDTGSRSRIELVQVYGDAVLTRAVPSDEKRQPVLVLAVRTDTGWRLRDLFEPD